MVIPLYSSRKEGRYPWAETGQLQKGMAVPLGKDRTAARNFTQTKLQQMLD